MLTLTIDESYAQSYLKLYRYNAAKLFKFAVETNPEAFPLLALDNLEIYSVNFLDDLFDDNFRSIVFVKKKGGNEKFSFLTIHNTEDYSDFNPLDQDNLNKKKIVSKHLSISIDDVLDIIVIDEVLYKNIESDRAFLNTLEESYFKKVTKYSLQDCARVFQEHINNPISYYAKNAAKFAYSLLDLDPILKKVNNNDFNYQMDQAIAAYDNSLYLASCATLGVCLETLCKLLLEKEGVRLKDSDATMLDKLSERLKENKIINYKFKQRIDVCYKVRNIASHTSPGKIIQNDCHFIINTIHEIVDTYF